MTIRILGLIHLPHQPCKLHWYNVLAFTFNSGFHPHFLANGKDIVEKKCKEFWILEFEAWLHFIQDLVNYWVRVFTKHFYSGFKCFRLYLRGNEETQYFNDQSLHLWCSLNQQLDHCSHLFLFEQPRLLWFLRNIYVDFQKSYQSHEEWIRVDFSYFKDFLLYTLLLDQKCFSNDPVFLTLVFLLY